MSATPEPEPRKPWFEAQPERLAWELAVFAEYGLPAEERAVGELLSIRTSLPFRGEQIEIEVVFPFDYPDVEPTVIGPPILLRHQNRLYGKFCLLDNPAAEWRPNLAAANLIDEDLRQLLADSEAGPEAVAEGEADVAEPLTESMETPRDPVVLVPDPFWELELRAARGKLELAPKAFGHGYVQVLAGGLEEPDRDLLEPFLAKPGTPLLGRWIKLDEVELLERASRQDLLDAALEAAPELTERFKPKLGRGRDQRWLGITYLEEGPEKGQIRRGWLFMALEVIDKGEFRLVGMAGAQALRNAERLRRIPELAGLEGARMLVVGAGSLGAPIALELARAGVGRIDLVDDDPYDVNNAVRHPLDPRQAGVEKAEAVAGLCRQNNPFIEADAHRFLVGRTAEASTRLDEMMRDADVVIDATASADVARVLQRRCREFGKPFVFAALTAGSYGGEVGAFGADGPCYACFVYRQAEGEVPEPLQGPMSTVTPVGCRGPAFSGAGFDATALAATAVRTAVRMSGRCSYPPLDYDYVIVNFRGEHPWRQGRLESHPDCPLCS